jgi:hypothetical protein
MTFKSKNTGKDQLAEMLAAKIIRFQKHAARRLTVWFNSYPKRTQVCILAGFCVLMTATLVVSLLLPVDRLALTKIPGSPAPGHIGLPSERPVPRERYSPDSLTTKH